MIQILAAISLLLGGYCAVMNNLVPLLRRRTGRSYSVVPLFSGLLLTLGLYGFDATRRFAWLGFVLDFYGTLAVVAGVPVLLFLFWKDSRFNRVHRFSSESDGRTAEISLFRDGHCTVELRFYPPIPTSRAGVCYVSGGMGGTWQTTDSGFLLNLENPDTILELSRSEEVWRSSLLRRDESNDVLPKHLDGVVWDQSE